MTPIDLQDRAQYLSLALFAQEIVSVLMEYVDENSDQRLKPALEEALNSSKSRKAHWFPHSEGHSHLQATSNSER